MWPYFSLKLASHSTKTSIFLKTLPWLDNITKIKLVHNENGYNEFTNITNKINSNFMVPNGHFSTLNVKGYNDLLVMTNIFQWSRPDQTFILLVTRARSVLTLLSCTESVMLGKKVDL